MKRRHYDASTIAPALLELERGYGRSSADFYESYLADAPQDVPRFVQHVWASFYRDYERLSGAKDTEFALEFAR